MLRGVRGATTVEDNEPNQIRERVQEMLSALTKANDIDTIDIAAAIFSTTPDLNSAFPATGARALGWTEVPLFGTQEIDNPSAVSKCVRVLLLWNTERPQSQITHLYLHNAAILRPDLSKK